MYNTTILKLNVQVIYIYNMYNFNKFNFHLNTTVNLFL